MRSIKAALAALLLAIPLLSVDAFAQAPPVTITCGNPGVLCGTTAVPLVTAPSSGGTTNTNITQFGSNPVVTGTGASGVGIPRVTLSNDSSVRILGNAGATMDAPIGAGTAPTNMQVGGGIYNTTAPAPTDGQSVGLQLDETGRLRTTAQPAAANMVTGTANTTGTSTTSLVSLVASKRLYVVGFSCANTGATASLISFQDGSGGTTLWTTIVPAGGGSNISGNAPLFKTTAGNALFFVAGSASTTIYCSAAGFSGS